MDKNIYEDIKLAWAEYEYLCSVITSKVSDIISNDYETLCNECDKKDSLYIDISIQDATITITTKPVIFISTIKKIEKLIGIDGKVTRTNSKKNPYIKIVFDGINIDNIDQ